MLVIRIDRALQVKNPPKGLDIGNKTSFLYFESKVNRTIKVQFNSFSHHKWLPHQIIDYKAEENVKIDPKIWPRELFVTLSMRE